MKSVQSVKDYLEKCMREHEAKAKLWKKVTRLKKKDGSDFKTLSKNFGNAKIYANYMQRNVIGVNGWVNNKYVEDKWLNDKYIEDEMDIWEYADETKLNLEEHTVIKEAAWSRAYIYLTADEIWEKIEKQIKFHEQKVNEYREQLAKADKVFTEFAEAIDAALIKLKEKAGDHTSLYYQCREYMKTTY